MKRTVVGLILNVVCLLAFSITGGPAWAAPFVAVKDGKPVCDIVVDTRGSLMSRVAPTELTRRNKNHLVGDHYLLMSTWADFLSSRIKASSGAKIPVLIDVEPGRPAIIISLAENYPDIAKQAGLSFEAREKDPLKYYDAFCIATTKDRLYVLGHTDLATRYAVAELLRRLGHRFYNPSFRWWIAPQQEAITVNLNTAHVPQFFSTEFIGSAGHDCSDAVFGGLTICILWDEDTIWGSANQTSIKYCGSQRFVQGPCFNLIVLRNRNVFAEHPEYFAMSADGMRNTNNTSRFCVTNPDLIEFVTTERVARLKEARKKYRFVPAITIEGFSGCQCSECKASGTETDLLFSFYNQVAKGVRKALPDACVIVRCYAQPPSFEIEPNILVQVPKRNLHKWKPKANLLAIEDNWGGLVPGAHRAQHPEYHQQAVPEHLENNVRAIQVNTPYYWGALTPSAYIGFQLFRDKNVDVQALLDEYYSLCFGRAAQHLRDLQAKVDAAPELTKENLLPRFRDLDLAYQAEDNPAMRQRIVDLMSYYHFLLLWHEKDLIKKQQGGRDDVYWHEGVLPVMRFASRTRYRQMLAFTYVTYSLCLRDALADDRKDFYSNYRLINWIHAKQEPIWSHPDLPVIDPKAGFFRVDDPGLLETFNDDEVLGLFQEDLRRLTKELER